MSGASLETWAIGDKPGKTPANKLRLVGFKSLELHYTMIQFLIILDMLQKLTSIKHVSGLILENQHYQH